MTHHFDNQPSIQQTTRTITLNLRESQRSIPYVCGADVWRDAAAFVLERFPNHAVVVITDANILAHYEARFQALFGENNSFARFAGILTIPAGEQSKCRAEKDRLEDELFARKLGRDTVIVAVGGGVVGDLAGYVAATFNRGVPLVHLPTSLLAMVDSSIGGKTGMNHPAGKNLIGAFYQPEAVFASVDALTTLSEREFTSGMAEVLKYAATLDFGLWELLETSAERVQARDTALLQEIILRSASIKINVVQQDEKESGLRALLNFGHTVGHAFEALSHYEIPHGFAVAGGMRVAMRLSRNLLGYPQPFVERFDALLAAYNLKHDYSSRFQNNDIWNSIIADKKSRQQQPRFVLMRTPTEYVLAHSVERGQLEEVL